MGEEAHGALRAAAGVVLLAEEVEVDHAPFQLQASDSWEKVVVVDKKIQHYCQLLKLLVWNVWEIYPHKYPVHSHAPEDLFSLLVDPFFSAVDLYAY